MHQQKKILQILGIACLVALLEGLARCGSSSSSGGKLTVKLKLPENAK